jgi:hypothetical protein
MKHLSVLKIAVLLLAMTAPAFAVEMARIVPRSQQIARPADQVYASLKKYFTDSSLSNFKLLSEDPKTRTLTAELSGIDSATWTRWAFCKTGPVEMIYKYDDGSAKVTVHVERTDKKTSFVTVTADFQGKYSLGDSHKDIACSSKGGLEETILSVAGSAPAK